MNRTFRKITALLICAVMLAGLALPAFAAENITGTDAEAVSDVAFADTAVKASENSYTYVFVHGMMGWGENSNGGFSDNPYWGFKEENDVPAYLRSLGYDVAVPSVGPMSSAWDRACELYAQLTGTVVDYGAAHSERCGHERYGRDYTGRAVMNDGEGWDLAAPINIITHSFGGPTAAVFTSIMEYGAQEEIEASPEDCSEFFKGGKAGLVYSVSTLASPHNGSPISNLLYDTKLPVLLVAFFMNVADIGIDFMFDQYGITKDPSTGERAKFNWRGIMSLYKNNDHCAYDMTIKGARELNDKFPIAEHTYYFSYSGDITEDGKLGRKVSGEFATGVFTISSNMIITCAGKRFDGEKLGSEWAANDGLVPVVSALYPFGHDYIEYAPDTEAVPGIWHVMPTTPNASHGYHVGGQKETLFAFYNSLLAITENI